jgi:hypothetical protein
VLLTLLAVRLETDEQKLPKLNFFVLATLALAGEHYSDALAQVVTLNALRNDYNHELSGAGRQEHMRALAECTGAFWPTTGTRTDSPVWPEACDRAVRMSCGFCLAVLWCHFAELILATNRVISAEAGEKLRNELASFKDMQRQQHELESSVSQLFAWLLAELSTLKPQSDIDH